MCLVLDVNAFSNFFEDCNPDHSDYIDAKNWIFYGKGKIVFGGSKYIGELKKAKKYLRLFTQLERAGKIVRLDDKSVDSRQEVISGMESSSIFDDPHLIAIVCVSKCRIVCTRDARAIPFLKDTKFYSRFCPRPKIYRYARHKSLLTEGNIAEICRC